MNREHPLILLFNGPPRCGKDTAAMHLCKVLPHRLQFYRMSHPIKKAFAAITNTLLDSFGNNLEWESRKDSAITPFGVTYRQWQIDFSERFMKPLYGEHIFGRLFADHFSSGWAAERIVLVPDCGFEIERAQLVERFGRLNVRVIAIHRPDCNFEGDSRGYLSSPDVTIINDKTEQEYLETVHRVALTLIEHYFND